MNDKKNKSRFLNMTTIKIVGVLLLFFSAIVLLWHSNAHSFY